MIDAAQIAVDERRPQKIVLCALLLYAMCWHVVPEDFHLFLFPWLDHIQARGPIGAFAAPFSNYTPPYLYLMAAASLLPLGDHEIIKLLSVLGSIFLAFSVWRLVAVIRPEKATEAGLLALVLPTAVVNAGLLGQCDALWAGTCVLAVAFALERKLLAMVVWAGIGFAFKAQAAFIAPFVIAILVRERAPVAYWAVPPLVYAAAMAPAYAMGWPAYDLAMVYARQSEFYGIVSTAPNPWAVAAAFFPAEAPSLFWIGYAAAAAAAVALIVAVGRLKLTREQLVVAALLSAMMLPWLLPKMHERYFFLGDILAYTLAYTHSTRAPSIFVSVQAASLLALMLYFTNNYSFAIGGAALTTTVILTLLKDLRMPTDETERGREVRSEGEQLA